jgi:hypothetical protein
MAPGDAWNIYTGTHKIPLFETHLTGPLGENTFMSWAKIVDCGDVRMTLLDNRVALKQLDKAHQVNTNRSTLTQFPLTRLIDYLWATIINSIKRPYTADRSSWRRSHYDSLGITLHV